MEPFLLGKVIKTQALIHHTKHQAPLEQEQHFQALNQAQAEDRQLLQSLIWPE